MSILVAEKKEIKEGRINLMAEPSWIKKLERAAAIMGVSVSAYLRVAANEKMRRDAREYPELADESIEE